MKRRSFIKFAAAAIAALGLSKVVPAAEPPIAAGTKLVDVYPNGITADLRGRYVMYCDDKIAFGHATKQFNFPALGYRERCGKV